jgi:DnaK suppressor protein
MVNEITDVAGSGQKDQLRRQLQKELDGIAARLHRKTEALSTEVDGRDFIDVAQSLEGQGQEQLIASRLMEQARRLRVALTRLDDGEYGVCSECGARIPQKRLLAIPDAATCVACQDRLEHYTTSAKGKTRPRPTSRSAESVLR